MYLERRFDCVDIFDRIVKVLDDSGLSIRAFAESIKVSHGVITNIKYRKVEKPTDIVIRAICEAHNVNIRWLETGEGDPYLPEMTPSDRAAEIRLIMKGAPDIQVAIMSSLAQMPPEWWDTWAKQLYAELDKANEKGR